MGATSEASRIDHLDVLRGIAILGILFINLPGAATYYAAFFGLEFIAGWSLIAGKKAPDNYWGEGATTLEWTLSSPPPHHQFTTLPKID